VSDTQLHLHQVVSSHIFCLYISGERSEEEKKYSDTHQVVSEWDFICILQVREDRVTEDSVRTCLQVGNSP